MLYIIYFPYITLQPVPRLDCTRDNLIPGMNGACHWGVESGKLMYPSTFEHVLNVCLLELQTK
jgi:hypothetical protein